MLDVSSGFDFAKLGGMIALQVLFKRRIGRFLVLFGVKRMIIRINVVNLSPKFMKKDMKTRDYWVRVAMTLTVLLCCLTKAWADDVTAEQALQLAQDFVNNHQKAANGSRRAAGADLQLNAAGQVDGLYVFNVGNDGGFVIVSNDDRTTPILGFSDSGFIDLDKIPSNMKAWLQGYADEIAWLQQNGSKVATRKALAKTSSWEVGQSKTPIEPLIKTIWNQGEPYNNLCPEYATDKKSATGCVATAMAQVMYYYYQKGSPSSSTEIPAYTDGYGQYHAALPDVTFDWANMLLNYVNDDKTIRGTDAQKTAVATLMKYCGWGAKMDYNEESSSNTGKALTALKEYFGYNKTTTQCVSRSYYSYANWVDLIYSELSQDRPVFYSGQSSGGGHAFVCDGYKYEDETDYFHINWGWGGLSDNYFVLSVLDPDQQGIGGSASLDGFHYGQEAIVGIQPSTWTGTVANIPVNTVSLTLNSLTLNHSTVGVGVPVTAALNVTNNSDDAYDGDVYLGYKDGSHYYLLQGNDVSIPSKQAEDCTITFTLGEAGTYDLYFFTPDGTALSYSPDGKLWGTLNVVEEVIPTDPAVTYTAGLTAEVSWTNASTATAYDIDVNGTVIENVTNPYTISGLVYGTEYKVKVRAKVDGVLHRWIKVGKFTTEAPPVPTNLAATNITPVSATITWTGNGTDYNLRYRKGFYYDFETATPWAVDDFAPCTTYDGDGTKTGGIQGVAFTNQGYTGSLIAFQNGPVDGFSAHSGNAFGCFMYTSRNNDWFILPELTIAEGDVFSFWARSYTSSYEERFKVGVYGNTDGTFASYLAGGASTYVVAPTTWTQYSYDLSAYAGQTIQLAINCVSEDAFAFFIDDIYVGNPDAWTTITNVTSPSKLSGLAAETPYEYQVQAICGEKTSEWTSSSSFTTLSGIALSDAAVNNTSVIGSNHTNVVNVALDGRTLWQDGGWNTICLPFDLTIAGSVLDGTGVEARQLTEASITDKTLNLTFSGPVTTLAAGTPYIIKWTSGDNIVDPVFTSVTINEAMNSFDNKASGDAKVRFIANYDKKAFGTVDTSILFVGESNTLYYPESGATIGACRAYFKIGEDGAASRAITGVNFDFGEDDETTEIESVDDSQLSTLNSQLSGWYTLSGVKLEGKPTAPGIYICGGRRVVIK